MTYTIQQLQEIFPGKWSEIWRNHPAAHAVLATNNYQRQMLYLYKDGAWHLHDNTGYYKNVTFEQAKKFYKKHFKLTNFA